MAPYDPVTASAHSKVANEIYAKRLRRQPCERCQSTKNIDAHHDDYTKPLTVRWLCRSCHKLHHLAFRAAAKAAAQPAEAA